VFSENVTAENWGSGYPGGKKLTVGFTILVPLLYRSLGSSVTFEFIRLFLTVFNAETVWTLSSESVQESEEQM
jgi:hypothetical protein